MEKETKHTPEWSISKRADRDRILRWYYVIYSEDNKVLAHVWGYSEEEAKNRAKLIASAPSLKSEIDRLQKENKHLKNRIDSDWYVRELNNEISEMKKQIDELHNGIMTQWEKDYGSIHNEQSMDAYTVSGFMKSILTRIK